MTRAQLRTALPAAYAVCLVVAALTGSGAILLVVAVVGAMLLGLAYSLMRGGAGGRDRQRNRNRRP